ncbi:MAG: hypothetical protein V7698_15790 [Paracoccaceae bacterium]
MFVVQKAKNSHTSCEDRNHMPEEVTMVERKSALKRAPERPRLQELLRQAQAHTVTEEELKQQRASFVYGNAPKGSRITKASAQQSVEHMRVTKVPA